MLERTTSTHNGLKAPLLKVPLPKGRLESAEELALARAASEPLNGIKEGPMLPLDRSCSTPGHWQKRRYVAYAANPFRADFAGSGTAFLPRGIRARFQDQLGDRAALGMCSLHRKEELMSEVEFHDMLEQVEEVVSKEVHSVDTLSDALLALLSALVTSPLIVMPYYASINGVLLSSFLVMAIAMITLRSSLVMHRCLDVLEKEVPHSETPPLERDYGFLAHHAFGRTGMVVVIVFYTLDYYTSMISYFVVVERIWIFWSPLWLQEHGGTSAPLLAHALATFVMLFAPGSIFNWTQIIALASTLVLWPALGLQALPRVADLGLEALPWLVGAGGLSASKVACEVATVIFGYGNVSILPKMTTTWRGRPQRQGYLLRTAFVLSGLLYILFSIVGAAAYEVAPPDVVFQLPGVWGLTCQVSYLLRLQMTLPLLANPCIHVMQDMLGIAQQIKSRFFANLVLILSSAALATCAGGQIDAVMALVGAGITTSLIIIIPPLIGLRVCREDGVANRMLNILQAGLGVALAAVGMFAGWQRLQGPA